MIQVNTAETRHDESIRSTWDFGIWVLLVALVATEARLGRGQVDQCVEQIDAVFCCGGQVGADGAKLLCANECG
jgi:hypothetical protein